MKKTLFSIAVFFIIINLNAQCLSGNCNNGYGVKKYQDGTLYIGEWWNDTPSGKGTVIWSDGSIYIGDFEKGAYNGAGTHFTAKSLYIGEFENDLPNGYGTFFMNPGSMYVGNFEKGEMHGKGLFQHPDGTIEEAFWQQGKPVGDIIQEEDKYILRQ